MKWIEVITLRSLVKENRQMVDELLRQVFKQKESGLDASSRVYHHPTVETDLSIHIHWENGSQPPSEALLANSFHMLLRGWGCSIIPSGWKPRPWNDHW